MDLMGKGRTYDHVILSNGSKVKNENLLSTLFRVLASR
jgi:hypothetical protein